NQADYSIDIELPYATATPLPEIQESLDALVIDDKGSVYVNDTSLILDDSEDYTDDPNSNYKSLRLGNTGLAVQALQTRLQELGYFTQGVSGIFDANTEAAVRRFEQTYGTMQTGVATAEMQSRLFAADALVYASEAYNEAVVSQYTILQRGDVGSSVYALQQRLKNLGYPIDELTGIFDNETANAVMLFYEAYGLTASDIANVALQKELYSDSARTYGNTGVTSTSDSLAVMTDEDIIAIQYRLSELGFLNGAVSGTFDKNTEIAVKLFEEACGELPSGTLTKAILTLLESENAPTFASISSNYPNLLEGSSGDNVTHLQYRLAALGFAKGTPNGEYGPATTASVKLFQAANGLEETGAATSYVQAVLYSAFALNVDGETIVTVMEPEVTAEPEIIDPETLESEPVTQEIGFNDPEMPVTANQRLSVGSNGDAVLKLQNRLTELGYVTSITGTYDNLTGRAISAVQTSLGIEPTGNANTELLELLYSAAAPRSSTVYHKEPLELFPLAQGDTGEYVTNLQRRLWELGYLTQENVEHSIGTYHDGTANAVRDFKAAIGYAEPDGDASVEFQSYLFSAQSDQMKK
ncbi:MAG: peptidoglycan-binding protein, partial [Clostridia bacterium]|nr:peptidoglycan-binding protein [Clostridia bacterium]